MLNELEAAGQLPTPGILLPKGYAVVDDLGMIRVADASFCARIAAAFPAWRGPALPAEVLPIPGTRA